MEERITEAVRSDIPELFRLQLRAFESEAEMIGSRNVPALMESEEENAADFDNWTVLIRRDETGRILAAARYRDCGDYIEVGRVMTDPDCRRQGLAQELMREIEKRAGGSCLELYTCTRSYINIDLYEKLGYRIYKEEKGERDLSFAYMRKTLV